MFVVLANAFISLEADEWWERLDDIMRAGHGAWGTLSQCVDHHFSVGSRYVDYWDWAYIRLSNSAHIVHVIYLKFDQKSESVVGKNSQVSRCVQSCSGNVSQGNTSYCRHLIIQDMRSLVGRINQVEWELSLSQITLWEGDLGLGEEDCHMHAGPEWISKFPSQWGCDVVWESRNDDWDLLICLTY